jgi:hypothetical protein
MARRLPVGRIATPDDTAPAYLFLMENDFAAGTSSMWTENRRSFDSA